MSVSPNSDLVFSLSSSCTAHQIGLVSFVMYGEHSQQLPFGIDVAFSRLENEKLNLHMQCCTVKARALSVFWPAASFPALVLCRESVF